jgi:hypothetical protein
MVVCDLVRDEIYGHVKHNFLEFSRYPRAFAHRANGLEPSAPISRPRRTLGMLGPRRQSRYSLAAFSPRILRCASGVRLDIFSATVSSGLG